jgi:hypothetical protein
MRKIRPAIRLPEIPPAPPKPKSAKVKDKISVIRIDPINKMIAKLVVEMSTEPGDGHAQIARLLRANQLGTQMLNVGIETLLYGTVPLVAAGVFGISSEVKGWFLEVLRDDNELITSPVTGGLSMIMAIGPGGGMVSLPPQVTTGWVRAHIRWDDGIPESAPDGSGVEGELS